jgi:hypothetical protein
MTLATTQKTLIQFRFLACYMPNPYKLIDLIILIILGVVYSGRNALLFNLNLIILMSSHIDMMTYINYVPKE